MNMISPASEILSTTQIVLLDAGRWLLTGAVTLFLGYAILMLSVLLISALAGMGPRRPKVVLPLIDSSASSVSAHGGLNGVVMTPGLGAIGDPS